MLPAVEDVLSPLDARSCKRLLLALSALLMLVIALLMLRPKVGVVKTTSAPRRPWGMVLLGGLGVVSP